MRSWWFFDRMPIAALGGGEPNRTMAGIGGGIIVVSIPIVKSCNKNQYKQLKPITVDYEQVRFGIKISQNYHLQKTELD